VILAGFIQGKNNRLFTDDRQKCMEEPGLDLRFVYSEDEMVMRLRDMSED